MSFPTFHYELFSFFNSKFNSYILTVYSYHLFFLFFVLFYFLQIPLYHLSAQDDFLNLDSSILLYLWSIEHFLVFTYHSIIIISQHTHTHTHTYIYIYIYIYMYVCMYVCIDIKMNKIIRQIGILLFCCLFFHCIQLVSTLDHLQEKKFIWKNIFFKFKDSFKEF